MRRALAAQLELDQYLAGLIGKVDLSPEAVFAGAGRSSRLGRASIFAWLGWTVCLGMMGFVVSMLVWAYLVRPNNGDPQPSIAQNGPGNENAAGGGNGPPAAKGADPTAKASLEHAAVGGAGDRDNPALPPRLGIGRRPRGNPANAAGMIRGVRGDSKSTPRSQPASSG